MHQNGRVVQNLHQDTFVSKIAFVATGSAGSKITGAGTAFYILTRMFPPSRSQHCKTEFPFTVENVSF